MLSLTMISPTVRMLANFAKFEIQNFFSIPENDFFEVAVEQGLTSHQTHYRSYWGRVFMGQMTQPTVSKHWRKIGPKD